MKILKKLALGAVGAASGVLIACAYGIEYAYSWFGTVQDSVTGDPIDGIRVTCVVDGQESGSTYTDANGNFIYDTSQECEAFRFTDVDGADNGTYDATDLTLPEGTQNNVDLDPSA